ncbi:MAG TPA: DUF4245 domain-containing protein [Candidatus Nanopelagicales bacterium]|nr:DUF4245 domain-containing protein [Candidatus Nanopelagicales bacterium]
MDPEQPTAPEQPVVPEAQVPEEPHEDPAAIAAEREARASRRLRQTARDMALSMLVVAGVVLLIWLPFRPSGDASHVSTVDPTPVIDGARKAEPWPVLAPVGLGAAWRCTSARIEQAADGQDVVHLGYLSPTSTYVGLEQSATKATSFVFDATVKGREKGSTDVAGTTWTTYENDEQDHRALVRTADGATYVVVGTGPYSQLEEFASKLRAG